MGSRNTYSEAEREYNATLYAIVVDFCEREDARTRGRHEGMRRGLAPLARLCGRKIGRGLTAAERETLRARLSTLGADRLCDVVFDFDGPALDRWLGDPDAT